MLAVKDLKIIELERKEKVTRFTAITTDGQVTYYIVCWHTPKTVGALRNMWNGDHITAIQP